MDIMALLSQIFELCVIPLLGILTKFLIDFLKSKSQELQAKTENDIEAKYLQKITETIITCVVATNQTYVESLKKQGKFDANAQEAAFKMTYEAVVALLSDEIKKYIVDISGDLQLYLSQKIEAEVNSLK